MASPAAFRLVTEEPELALELPAQTAVATDDAPVGPQPEQQDDVGGRRVEDLQDAYHDVSEAANQQPGAADLDAEPRRMPPSEIPRLSARSRTARISMPRTCRTPPTFPRLLTRSRGATKCTFCSIVIQSNEERKVINGRLYHATICSKNAKSIAIAAE